MLREVLGEVDRLEVTVTHLVTITRTPELRGAAVTVSDVVAGVHALWQARFAQDGRRLVVDLAPSLPRALANPSKLRQMC